MLPLTVRREQIVPIPLDVVWQLIEPASALAVWLPFAERGELVSGEGLGRVQRVWTTAGGGRREVDYEIVEYRPQALLRWRQFGERAGGGPAAGGQTDLILTIRLQSVGPGTLVVLEARVGSSSLLRAIGARLVERRRIAKGFERGLARLAAAGR
jgi:Polyketide cyclase / dehydrase and lipid transport